MICEMVFDFFDILYIFLYRCDMIFISFDELLHEYI